MTKTGTWGRWKDRQTGRALDDVDGVTISGQGNDDLDIAFFIGEEDGKPVIQIDGDGDFRINVNDGVVFNRSTESNDFLRDMALAMYHEEVGKIRPIRYDNYELVKIRAELIQVGYSPDVVDSHGTLPETDPFMWVIVNRTGPDMRKQTALCNELHMHSDNVDEAWALARDAGTRSMRWITLSEDYCRELGIECNKCA